MDEEMMRQVIALLILFAWFFLSYKIMQENMKEQEKNPTGNKSIALQYCATFPASVYTSEKDDEFL